MTFHLDDTIVAAASPPGGAARAIVRLAGPRVVECLQACFQGEGHSLPSPFGRGEGGEGTILPSPAGRGVGSEGSVPTAVPGSVRLDGMAATLPCDLYLWPGPRSYTGGPLAELHALGSPPLADALLRTLCRAGARLAEPGEFTLRAFLTGRIDLTEAEAVLGVVEAADARQLDTALSQLAGGLARPLNRLRDDLLELLAHLEAGFDFADQDLQFITAEQLAGRLDSAARALAGAARQMSSRRDASDTARAVLVGRPNTGKSSLFNALAGRQGAIVSHVPGTTRDYLSADLDLDGARCRLIDTAGIEDEKRDVHQAAQTLGREQARQAQVRIFCLDTTRPLDAWEREELGAPAPAGRLLVLTKADAPQRTDFTGEATVTSAATGEGLESLRLRLREAVLSATSPAGGAVGATAARCGESMRLAGECLDRARGLAAAGLGEELIAAEVRSALEEVGKVVGAVYTDDVLDRVFSRFCIGK